MAASISPVRRKRYLRSTPTVGLVLSDPKRRLLETVAEYRLVSLPQLAERTGLPLKSARRYMRQLFDHGLVEVVAVPRLAFAEIEAQGDPTLLYGSAPNVYVISKNGAKILERDGFLHPSSSGRGYGPRNFVYLAHELQIRSVRLWFERLSRTRDEFLLERWVDGSEAELPLGSGPNDGVVRPDAWCVFRIGQRVMVSMIEVDRGTERGDVRWRQKIDAYGRLLPEPGLVQSTGYSKARVLTITPNERRRDQLASLIGAHAAAELADRFWLMARPDLDASTLSTSNWKRPRSPELSALLSEASLAESLGSPASDTGPLQHPETEARRVNGKEK